MNCIGTKSIGIKAPLIKKGDNIVDAVVDSVLKATEKHPTYNEIMFSDKKEITYDLNDKDIIGITESVVARSQGNYVTIDEIANEIKSKFGEHKTIDLIYPIYSRNRFAMILKGIARGCDKLRILMPEIDEVGNVRRDHPFTKMNYDEYYAEICVGENCEIEIYSDPTYLEHKENLNLLLCQLHVDKEEAYNALGIFMNHRVTNCYSLKDIFDDRCEYGLLGSNKATEDTLKLFPMKKDMIIHGEYVMGSDKVVNAIKEKIKKRTGKDVIVVVYADGCFKDPVGGIWEFADPVSMVSFTDEDIIMSTPNELKLKAHIDDYDGDNLDEYIKESITNKDYDLKGNMKSQGTTPRLIRDLVASLMDLTSGSGDKGTPIVLVQNYFNNYATE